MVILGTNGLDRIFKQRNNLRSFVDAAVTGTVVALVSVVNKSRFDEMAGMRCTSITS